MKTGKKTIRYIIVSCVGVIAGTLLLSAAKPDDFQLGKNLQILFNMFRELSLFYVDPVDTDELLKNAAAGMVSDLDPYTELIPESEMSAFEIETTGKYGGIGAGIRKKREYVEIAQPYRNFPADKAGLAIGDRILAIDGEDTKGFNDAQVSNLLRGDPGTTVHLKIEKMLTGEQVNVAIRRERIAISGVSYYGVVSDSIGYIVQDRFTEDCSNDVRKAFMELRKQGIKSLVLDLRDNGGGILQEAVKIMAIFVPKGTEVVSMRGREKSEDAIFKTQTEPVDTEIPIVVLVNNNSASSAEIAAGVFQDLDRGILVGQKTFGKGLVQTPRPLGYNTYLKVTTAKYYIPSGRCIQAIDYAHRKEDGTVGFVPDSLINEFQTANGRKVYDGGGVMPDIKMEAEESVSRFTIVLYAKGYIEDFANEYQKRHQGSVDIDTFKLSDTEYANFVAFMKDKEVDFESETLRTIQQLRQKAEREKYLDRISGDLDALEAKLGDDKAAELQLFREEISRLIEDEIVLRYHYMDGVIRHKIPEDTELKAAVELLSNRDRYRTIIASQDTSRK